MMAAINANFSAISSVTCAISVIVLSAKEDG